MVALCFACCVLIVVCNSLFVVPCYVVFSSSLSIVFIGCGLSFVVRCLWFVCLRFACVVVGGCLLFVGCSYFFCCCLWCVDVCCSLSNVVRGCRRSLSIVGCSLLVVVCCLLCVGC